MRVELKAGKLRKRLSIEQLTPPAANTLGETPQNVDGDWTNVATRWGSIEPVTGRELYEAEQIRADVTHTVTIRYYAGLLPSMRFTVANRTRVFNLVSILNIDERNRVQKCLVKEEVPKVAT